MIAIQMAAKEASFTATVSATDGVLFVATADNERAMKDQVVRFIQGRCDDVLWPADAAEVRSLIASDKLEAAIATYFDSVGKRWDPERLEFGGVVSLRPTRYRARR